MMAKRKSAYIRISHFRPHVKAKTEKEIALEISTEMS
jgi:hypothetical protein